MPQETRERRILNNDVSNARVVNGGETETVIQFLL